MRGLSGRDSSGWPPHLRYGFACASRRHDEVSAGLSPQASAELARNTIAGAAALMARGGEDPAELRRQVTSPGGTTQAALDVLLAQDGFGQLLRKAVAAAVRRSRELGV